MKGGGGGGQHREIGGGWGVRDGKEGFKIRTKLLPSVGIEPESPV